MPNPRPALPKLQQDQETIISDLRAGFDGLEELLQWCVKTNIRTLGGLDPEFYSTKIADRLALQWLTGEQRTNQSIDESHASGYREDLAITVERGANCAYRFFREQVSEYTDEQTPEVSMSGGSVAFRPALTELENRQIEALLSARTGFADRSALAAWERKMQAATFGEYVEQAVYPITRSPMSWEYGLMLQDVGKERPARDIFLMDSVFPACVRGVRCLRMQADEDVDDGGSDNETLQA